MAVTTTTRKTANAVEAAKARVRELLDVEIAYSDTRRTHAEELAAARRTHGERLLAGELTIEAAGHRVAELEGMIQAADAAIDAARDQRREAVLALYVAEADTKLAEASGPEHQAEALEHQAAPHLKALRDLEGIDYVPASDVVKARQIAVAAIGHVGPVRLAVPNSEALRLRAASLRDQAEALRGRRVAAAGQVEAGTAADLVQVAVMSDPMRIGPTIAAVEAWSATAIATEQADRQRVQHHGQDADTWRPLDAPMTLVLTWRGGEIVPRECGVQTVFERPEPTQIKSWTGAVPA